MRIHSLHFGLNYPGTGSELAGCVNDARDWQAVAAPFVVSSTTIINSKADRAGMLAAGRRVAQRLEPGDHLILTLSSHGTRERVNGRWVEAIVCADHELIYDYELPQLVAERPKRTTLFAFLDCCHAAELHRGFVRARKRFISIDECHTHDYRGGEKLGALPGAWGFHGSSRDGYAYDAVFDGKANGAFTYYGLKSLGLLSPGTSYRTWFQKIAGRRPRGYLPSAQYDQHPAVVGSRKNLARPVPLLV